MTPKKYDKLRCSSIFPSIKKSPSKFRKMKTFKSQESNKLRSQMKIQKCKNSKVSLLFPAKRPSDELMILLTKNIDLNQIFFLETSGDKALPVFTNNPLFFDPLYFGDLNCSTFSFISVLVMTPEP